MDCTRHFGVLLQLFRALRSVAFVLKLALASNDALSSECQVRRLQQKQQKGCSPLGTVRVTAHGLWSFGMFHVWRRS